ncbi:UvrD-helicase domain-containing protein [Paenibacillus xylanexedens]|uniref:UvrD-helicase domain-containing protein n=1 Tax=Paenibacillus xylanexedens TaxID=528191 RepID=UPI001F023EBE|nr:UvrD-helicase domain-containing protein [Paenibacillus xylanexedens]
MNFEEQDYEFVESLLLNGRKFNDLQRRFISLFETKTIVAGPGAGKTTSLAAKIILLFRHLEKTGSKDSLCIITYTNVAVNEINTSLTKAGLGEIKHPHFIGTIHEFLNHFCVIPYFRINYGHTSLFFDQSHSNDEEFYKRYLERTESWMKPGAIDKISENNIDTKLFFNKETLNFDLENLNNNPRVVESFRKNKHRMLKAKVARKAQGYLEFDDTFPFAEAFLSTDYYQEILRRRFKFVFVDEFQDTKSLGASLLGQIFNTESCILQLIGDPYQTIMYEQHSMPEIVEQDTFRMNLSIRFGKEISQCLNTILPEANIQVTDQAVSFRPHILLYEDKEEIYGAYKQLIASYEEQDQEFKSSIHEDKVLVLQTRWASLVKSGQIYSKSKSKKTKFINSELKKVIIDFLLKRLGQTENNTHELKKWLKNHKDIHILNGIFVDLLKNRNMDENKVKLLQVVNHILESKGLEKILISNNLFKDLEQLLSSKTIVEKAAVVDDDIYTIHSVKGETLRSALVVNFENGPLTKILFHRYGITTDEDYRFTDQNLLYVAMSRVSHLFVFAIHKDLWNEEVSEKFTEHWDIVYTRELVGV